MRKRKTNLSNLLKIILICACFLHTSWADAAPASTYRIPELDFNGDCAADLSDALAGLKIMAGTDAETSAATKIGIREIIRVLQWVAQMTPIPQGYDDYEEDDHPIQAGVIPINENADQDNGNSAQIHNFHDSGDVDWVMFYGIKGENYTITADIEEGNRCDVILDLYDTDGENILKTEDDGIEGESERMNWEECPGDGIYYVRARHRDPEIFGEDVTYSLTISNSEAPGFPGDIIGDVFDIRSKRFQLTRSKLDELADKGFPDDVMAALEGLKDREYATEDAFLRAVEETGSSDTADYESEILASATYFTQKIRNAVIRTSAGRTAISNYCHCYFFCLRDYCIYFHPSDASLPFTLTAYAPGYKVFTTEVTVLPLETTVLDIQMEPDMGTW